MKNIYKVLGNISLASAVVLGGLTTGGGVVNADSGSQAFTVIGGDKDSSKSSAASTSTSKSKDDKKVNSSSASFGDSDSNKDKSSSTEDSSSSEKSNSSTNDSSSSSADKNSNSSSSSSSSKTKDSDSNYTDSSDGLDSDSVSSKESAKPQYQTSDKLTKTANGSMGILDLHTTTGKVASLSTVTIATTIAGVAYKVKKHNRQNLL
ncbi:hypothetical protein EFL77_09530 [Pediococcus pentosaceus]|uniref:hypothetical protein n=1 Tax=Pediococcus pentosaceus TaxID=1255 RepID=UPI00223A714D|nr:hypothetical protein [Pediococcus pentosaceus]MCT1178728.1 hypothetical protein [Pediococcus pentosaceus]